MAYREGSLEAGLLSGDPSALGELFRWIAGVLASPRFWPLRPELPDLHQEIVARVLESLRHGRFDPNRDLRVYVQAVARYTAFEAMEARRSEGMGQPLSPNASVADPSAEDIAVSIQLARAVMDHATHECQRLIRAYFFDQQSYEEIAATQGVPIGTVKSRLSRCLERIHASLAGPRGRRAPSAER